MDWLKVIVSSSKTTSSIIIYTTEIQLYINKNEVPVDLPSYKRKYADMIEDFTAQCREMRRLIELRSIYFLPRNEPQSPTESLDFNYQRNSRPAKC